MLRLISSSERCSADITLKITAWQRQTDEWRHATLDDKNWLKRRQDPEFFAVGRSEVILEASGKANRSGLEIIDKTRPWLGFNWTSGVVDLSVCQRPQQPLWRILLCILRTKSQSLTALCRACVEVCCEPLKASLQRAYLSNQVTHKYWFCIFPLHWRRAVTCWMI